MSKPASLQNSPTWNDGSARFEAGQKDVPDVAYIAAILDDLAARLAVDKKKIYVAGMSNGGSMAFRVGAELSDRIAAIAVVAGALWVSPDLSYPVSLCYVTGTADPLNPLDGGTPNWAGTPIGGRAKPPVSTEVAAWANALGCSAGSKAIYDRDGVKGLSYAPCKTNSDVVLYTIEGMGHYWPGATGQYLPEGIIGKKVNTIFANDLIWDFFAAHPRR
jgi:polyhydroxybutyrate depolymerase